MKRNLPGEREVDLWWADLRRATGTSADQCLSPEEMARGARFASGVLRVRFFRRSTLLRLLLACYLDQKPAMAEGASAARSGGASREPENRKGLRY